MITARSLVKNVSRHVSGNVSGNVIGNVSEKVTGTVQYLLRVNNYFVITTPSSVY